MGKTIKSNDPQSKKKYIKKKNKPNKGNEYIKKYDKKGCHIQRVWPTDSENHNHKGPKI